MSGALNSTSAAWPFRVGAWLFRTTLRTIFVVAVCTSLVVSGAMAVSASLFGLVAAVIEATTDLATNRSRAAQDLADRDRRIALQTDEIANLRTDIEVRDSRIASQADEITNLRQTTARQADELARLDAERFVNFRGERRLLREAVSETTSDVIDRTARTAAVNIASMPGEGLPLLGIAVVVAATTLELKDACATSTAMYELDIAMNPDHAPTDRDVVCGMTPYTAEEIWVMIKDSPAAVWSSMVETYDNLPTFDSMFDWAVSTLKATPGQIWSMMVLVWDLVTDIELPEFGWPDWDLNPFGEPSP